MDFTPKDGFLPPPIREESADSELCASDAVVMFCGSDGEVDDDDDDDDDAQSCNCVDAYSPARLVYESCDDDAAGRGEETVGQDGRPVSWWEWLAKNAVQGTEKARSMGEGEEEEVASAKPVAPMEDRLFWETCLAYGYP